MDWHDLLRGLLATHLVLFIGGLIMLLLLAGMLRQKRSPAASAGWLVFMIAVPYVGVPLYLFFGNRKLKALTGGKTSAFTDKRRAGTLSDTGLQRLLAELQMPAPSHTEKPRFHRDADDARTSLLEMLDAARSSIDISTFILANDRIGREVVERLAGRAADGVRVRLILDSVGSFYLRKSHLRQLTQAGGQVAWFMPVIHVPLRGGTNLRNHRKLAIADGRRVWTGGRNIADEYLQPEHETCWIDLSFDLQGSAVADYVALFESDWAYATGTAARASEVPHAQPEGGEHVSQLLPSGPDMRDDALHDALARLLIEARKRILVVTPYFVPSEILQSLLCVAARSGVDVEILLPATSNHRLADLARQRFLRQLHQAGATIRCLPGAMLHAKAVVVDDRYALAGTANFDLRSLYLNFELMTLFCTRADVVELTHWIEGIQLDAVSWTPTPPGVIRETLEGLVLVAAFQL